MSHIGATERISTALVSLKNDLMEMRNQDVQLMKQLININSSLKEMNKGRRQTISRSSSKLSLSAMQRRQSNGSISSYNDISSSDDDTSSICSSENDYETIQQRRSMPSVAMIIPTDDADISDSYYRNILMTNVKLWKRSKSEDICSDMDI